MAELAERCTVQFERNVLSHVPASSIGEVAEDFKAIFKVRRKKTASNLAKEFVELYDRRLTKAVSVFEAGISDALTYRLTTLAPTTPGYAPRTTC